MTYDRKIAATLGLMAILVYVPLINWGLPYATASDRQKSFATDSILPFAPLEETKQMFGSKPMWNYKGYPFLQYFIDAAAQAPYAAYLYVSGQMKSPITGHPLALNDPFSQLPILELIGRCVGVVMSACTVMVAYFFSLSLFGRVAGVIAAILTMLNYLMVFYARTGNVDGPAFFWISIGMLIFAGILEKGLTVRRAVWLGAIAGLAMATKDQAIAFFLPLGLVLLLPKFQGSTTSYPVKTVLAGLGASVAAYATGTGMILHPSRNISHWLTILGKDPYSAGQNGIIGGVYYLGAHARTLGGFAAMAADYCSGLVATSSLPVLIASCVGVWLVARSSPRRLVLLLPVLGLFLLVDIPVRYVVRRYFLPLTLPIDAFAAYAVISLRKATARPLWVGAVVLLVGYRLLIAVDLSYSQYHDTRYAAAEWFSAHNRRGDRIGLFGTGVKLPHLEPSIVVVQLEQEDTTWISAHGGPKNTAALARAVVQRISEEKPEFIFDAPDWSSTPGMERSNFDPPEVFRYLLEGKGDYSLAAYFPETSLLSGRLKRPWMDCQCVSPPVRIFARKDVNSRESSASDRDRLIKARW